MCQLTWFLGKALFLAFRQRPSCCILTSLLHLMWTLILSRSPCPHDLIWTSLLSKGPTPKYHHTGGWVFNIWTLGNPNIQSITQVIKWEVRIRILVYGKLFCDVMDTCFSYSLAEHVLGLWEAKEAKVLWKNLYWDLQFWIAFTSPMGFQSISIIVILKLVVNYLFFFFEEFYGAAIHTPY